MNIEELTRAYMQSMINGYDAHLELLNPYCKIATLKQRRAKSCGIMFGDEEGLYVVVRSAISDFYSILKITDEQIKSADSPSEVIMKCIDKATQEMIKKDWMDRHPFDEFEIEELK